MAISLHGCSVCGQRFEVKHGFQVQALQDGVRYYCSQGCHEEALFQNRHRVCSQCGNAFELKYAFQQVTRGSAVQFLCSTRCRDESLAEQRDTQRKPIPPVAADEAPRRPDPLRIAVLNQKGGVGKTTTAISLAAGLAERGLETLLLDLDPQGHVAASLGAISKHGMHELLVEGREPRLCLTRLRRRLHAMVGDSRVAAVEHWLSRVPEKKRDRVLRMRLQGHDTRFDAVVIDCSPALALTNRNALTYADKVLIPVSCDYLSLVGVKQMLRTLDDVNRKLQHKVEIMGLIPTFYDQRNRISDEAVKTLRGYFRDKVLPPIRINTRLKEAPQHQQTIYEYAPDSHGARDYRQLVDWVIQSCSLESAPVGGQGEPVSRA